MQRSLALIRLIRKIAGSTQVLLFLNGLFIGVLAWLHIEAKYESQLFRSLAHHVKQYQANGTESLDSIVIRSLRITHQLEKNRSVLFGTEKVTSFKSTLLKPLTVDLMTAQEACGGFSYVLGRLLQEFDLDIRFAQMKVNGMYGGHILIETKMPYGWVVLDPMFDLYFTRKDGKLASFADVQSDWDYYSKQLPSDYKPEYNYSGVRYTNWSKIPVLMPAIKNVLSWSMGKEEAEKYSLRNMFLRKFDLLFYACLGMYLTLISFSVRRYYFRRKKLLSSMDPEMLFPKTSAPVKTQMACNPVTFPINV